MVECQGRLKKMTAAGEKFYQYVKSLVGKMIKVNRGGPESKSGLLA